jgi:hypothetical protein
MVICFFVRWRGAMNNDVTSTTGDGKAEQVGRTTVETTTITNT